MDRGSRRFIRLPFALHPVRLLAMALTVTAVGLAACGDDDATTTTPDDAGLSADPEGSEDIAIKTDVDIHIPKGGPVPGTPTA